MHPFKARGGGKFYVGSSTNLSKRLALYYSLIYLTKQSKNSLILRALLKYGHSNFSLDILEYCEVNKVIEREQYYIDTLKPEYNILQIAGSSYGYKHTEETLSKLKGRKVIGHKGHKHTAETIEKMRKSHLNKILSAEHKKKISIAVKAAVSEFNITTKGIKVLVLNLETNIIEEYRSISSAAVALNTHKETVRRCIKANKPYLDKYLITIKKI